MKQPKIVAKNKKIIEKDGLLFKDLSGDGVVHPYEDWRLPAEERAADLISRLTVEEKAGLLGVGSVALGISAKPGQETSHDGILFEETVPAFMFAKLKPGESPKMTPGTTEMLGQHNIRHLIVRENTSVENLAKWANTIEEVCEESRMGIPAVIISNPRNNNNDIGWDGTSKTAYFTVYPEMPGIAATGDVKVAESFAAVARKEFHAANFRKGYMNVADCPTDPRWYRVHETLGERPEVISEFITALIKGTQGDELDETSIALTTKHFPGGGPRENGFDPHYAIGQDNVYRTPGSLEKYHLPPFIAAVKAGTNAMMPYYAAPSEEKSDPHHPPIDEPFEPVGMAYNRAFIAGLLRGKLGFKGYVNSDTGVLDQMAWGMQDKTLEERLAYAINAGTDLFSGMDRIDYAVRALNSGMIDEKRLNEALTLTLSEMFKLGLFENPYADESEAANVKAPDELEKAYEAHVKSIVLLKNSNDILPLTEEKLAGKKVFVKLYTKFYSETELADRLRSGNSVDPADTARELVAKMREGFPKVNWVDTPDEADIAIVFMNPGSGNYFRATDGYLKLNINQASGIDMDDFMALRNKVGTVITHINLAIPFLLDNVEPYSDALSVGYGSFFRAVSDIIFGKASASGKLPYTLPANDEAIAIDENGICASPNDVPGYDKEKYMNGKPYIYTDTNGNRYVSGFGLKTGK